MGNKTIQTFINNLKPVKNHKGFTLIELLVVIAIIAIIAAVIFVGIDPIKRAAEARNSTRWQEAGSIVEAVLKYAVDNSAYPTGVDTTLRMLGTDGSGCDVSCGGGGGSFADDDQSDFNAGTYSDTQWDSGNSWVELTATGISNGTGTYTSSIKNAGTSTTWDTIAWTPQRPTYKELPSNAQSESAYAAGNANMSGNILLMHLNETSGSTAADSSGNSNDGTIVGTSSVSGKLSYARSFPGGSTSHYIIKNPINSFPSTNITVELWVKTSATTGQGVVSYASTAHNNDFLIFYPSSIRIYRGAVNVNTGVSVSDGAWHHLAVVWQSSGGSLTVYKDGVSAYSGTLASGTSITGNGSLVLGQEQDSVGGNFDVNQAFAGQIDEGAIYNRPLSGPEIADHYKRGALRLKYQVRSCDDAVCSGEIFIGPDGTASTYYSELQNSGTGLPSISLTNVSNNPYFQYRATFETDSASYTPELKDATIGYGASGGTTAPACLDLSSDLVDQYLPVIPQDPKQGSSGKTYYAIQKTTSNRIKATACGAEQGETISVQR